jgi:hypothetical protein
MTRTFDNATFKNGDVAIPLSCPRQQHHLVPQTRHSLFEQDRDPIHSSRMPLNFPPTQMPRDGAKASDFFNNRQRSDAVDFSTKQI